MLERIVKAGYGFVKSGYSGGGRPAADPETMGVMGNAQGDRIAARRKALNMSRQGLADVVGVSRQSIIKWEESKTPVEISRANLRELARALKCSQDYILNGGSLVEGHKAPRGLDNALLLDCLAGLQAALEGRTVAPERAAEIVAEAYEMWDESGTRPPKDVLLRFIRRRLMEN